LLNRQNAKADPRGMNRSLSLLAALATLVVVALMSLPSGNAVASGGQAPGAADPNPLAGQSWWTMDPKWDPRWIDTVKLADEGKAADALTMSKLAQVPQFRWWGQWEKPLASKLGGSFKAMENLAPGSVPLLVVHRHQGKACNPRYQAGGPAEDARYRKWIDQFAATVGSREVVIAFEPDSLGTIECLAKSRRKARVKMLAYGVDVLSKLPNATVYIEAGASDWQGVPAMAKKLKAVGVHKVRGFMLNATHQDTTANNIRYGERLSRALGGKHFIVNTSHNGNGSIRRKVWINRKRNLWRVDTEWCNPVNAAAGELPTTETGHALVDAFMWVERPGYSNGACNGGPARVGAWWRERALLLVQRAAWRDLVAPVPLEVLLQPELVTGGSD